MSIEVTKFYKEMIVILSPTQRGEEVVFPKFEILHCIIAKVFLSL